MMLKEQSVEYIPVLLMMAAGITIGGAVLLLSRFVGPQIAHAMKDQPFECGVPPLEGQNTRVSVRFYLVAILFLLFDVEAVFFFPFALVFRKFVTINSFILLEMGLFAGILLLGYFYVLRKGALEWE